MSSEYVEEGKQYQTEGDEEIITYDSGSQENGNLKKNLILCMERVSPAKNLKSQLLMIRISFQQAKLTTILTSQS